MPLLLSLPLRDPVPASDVSSYTRAAHSPGWPLAAQACGACPLARPVCVVAPLLRSPCLDSAAADFEGVHVSLVSLACSPACVLAAAPGQRMLATR